MACLNFTKVLTTLTECYSSNVPAAYNVPARLKDCVRMRKLMLADNQLMDFMARKRVNVVVGQASPISATKEQSLKKTAPLSPPPRRLIGQNPSLRPVTSPQYLLFKPKNQNKNS